MALATNSTPGSIVLAGDLTGTANTPELRVTGVTPGSYTSTNIVVDSKGRVVNATSGVLASLAGDLGGVMGATVLSSTAVVPGSYTRSDITVDSKGRVTAASSNNSPLSGDVSGSVGATVLSPSGAQAGGYTFVDLTVDSKGRITAASSGNIVLSGDVTGTPTTTTLTTTGVTAGSYLAAGLTVDSKGRVTAASSNPAVTLSGDVTGLTTATVLANTAVTPGSYTYANISVDSKGRVTASATGSGPTVVNATTSTKGVVQVSSYLTIQGGLLGMTLASGDTTYGAIKQPTDAVNNIVVVAGGASTGSNIPKLDTPNVFTRTVYQSCGFGGATLTPDLNANNVYDISQSTQPTNINQPQNAVTGDTFTITGYATAFTSEQWSTPTPAPVQYWHGQMTYANGKYVAICAATEPGQGTCISTDGVTWTHYTNGVGQVGIPYGNGVYCTFASGYPYTSTDAITWSAPGEYVVNSLYCRALIYGNGVFVLFGYTPGTGIAFCYTSVDGLTWIPRTLPVTAFPTSSVIYAAGLFVAAATDRNYVLTSSDGITWTTRNLPATRQWGLLSHGNGRFILLTNYNEQTAYSLNGITWVDGGYTGASQAQVMVYTGTEFCVWSGGSVVHYSKDGVDWYSLITTPVNTLGWQAMGTNGSQVVVLYNGNSIVTQGTYPIPSTPHYKLSNTYPTGNYTLQCVVGSGGLSYCTYI